MKFKRWMKEVDKYIFQCIGLESADLPDQRWRDIYASGYKAKDAAMQILANLGYSP